MNENEDTKAGGSRIAEIAVELMGAQIVAKLVEDAVSQASPEVRQKIYDAILVKIESTALDDWGVRSRAESLLAQVGEKVVAEHAAEFERAAREQITKALPAMMEMALQNVVGRVLTGPVIQAIEASLRR